MKLAEEVATWSKDPSTKVGAIITDHSNRVIGLGYNGFPRGVSDTEDRYADKLVKYGLIVHAEANAILNALTSVKECLLYTTKFPCSECAKLIIQSGIVKVYAPAPATDGKWADDANFSIQMLNESGVEIRQVVRD